MMPFARTHLPANGPTNPTGLSSSPKRDLGVNRYRGESDTPLDGLSLNDG